MLAGDNTCEIKLWELIFHSYCCHSSALSLPPPPYILEFLLLQVSSDFGVTLSRVGILNPEFMEGLEIIGKFFGGMFVF